MRKAILALAFTACAAASQAQTPVTTTGGTANQIPKFDSTGTAIVNSAVTETNGSVGIGTASPDSMLEVGNGNVGNGFHSVVGGGYAGLFENVNPSFGAGGILLWVKSVNQNIENYHFYVQGNNSPELVVKGNGTVGIGTSLPTAPLTIASGSVTGVPQIYNALTVQPAGGAAFGLNGSSIFLDSVTNHGINPVAGLWSSLDTGGDGGVNYGGSLVLGSTSQGNSAPIERMRVNSLGNVGIGTMNPQALLDVAGNVKISGTGANGGGANLTFPDNTIQTTAWNGIACGGDYAESVDVAGGRAKYEPGDVLVLTSEGSDGDVQKSQEAYSATVAGIYSTKPGITGRRQTGDLKDSKTEVPMAMVGIVPTKVSTENGPILRGDLLVTSSTLGYAMKGTDRSRLTGAVIGKAIGSLKNGSGIIEVLVTLQ